MFSSNDSLFEELTRQMENNTTTETKCNQLTSTTTLKATVDQNMETLPDIVPPGKKSNAITSLLMLGANPEQLDAEIDNEIIMPVNKPKQLDYMDEERNIESSKNSKNRKRKKKETRPDSPKKSKGKQNKTDSVEPQTKEFPSPPKSPGLPRGVLRVTRYELRKGKPNTYVAKPLKCSMCDQIVQTKDELREHHQEIHNIIACKDCGKGFTMKESLRKHKYTHTTGQSYECLLCKKFFIFPSELDAHMIIHETKPIFSCNIVGCSKSYFRKAELTAHIKTHDGKLWQCKCKGCNYKAVDKCYLTAHMRKHSDILCFFCRHCDEKFKHFEQRKWHEKSKHKK